MTPRFTAAIALDVFADTPEEARDRLMPYVREMRVKVDALEITDRQTGISYTFPIPPSPRYAGAIE